MTSEERSILETLASDVAEIKAQNKAGHMIHQHTERRVEKLENDHVCCKRVEKLENIQAKQNFLASLFGAIGAAIVLSIQVVLRGDG